MTNPASDIFIGQSAMARRCRSFAWDTTPLGASETWPISLCAMVRLILSAHHPMMVTWGPQYTQIFNDAFLPIVGDGARLDAALGADARVFWGPTWAAAMPNIEAVLHGGSPVITEDAPIPLERNGTIEQAYMTYSVSPALDDDGATTGLLIIAQETTERVRAAEAAVARERELHIIGEMARLGGWVVDLREGSAHWSDEVCALHGVPTGTKLRPEDGVRWFAPEFRDLVRTSFERTVADGTPYALEVQILTASGTRRWVRTTGELVRDISGQPQLVRGTLQDIEEQHAANARVREQAALLDLASDAIIVHDLVGTVLYWNAGAERMFGYRADEVLGRSAAEVSYEDAPIVGAAVERAMVEGEWAGELPMHRRDGSPLVFDSRWTIVKDANGAPYRILAIGTDVTDRKQLLQQFLRAQRMESIGALAGGIAHDLNNVLSPILMAIQLLDEEVASTEGKELLEMLQNSATRGAGMVKQILAFARGVEGEQHPVDLRHLAKDLERVVRETFPPKIKFENAVNRDLWAVLGNPTQFHQVLMNLVVNARDAMPQGGTIKVSAENVDVDEQYAAMSPDAVPGRYVRITVSDTGHGMPPDVLARIYEPFFTTKPEGQGTGLGIPTSLGIVRAHGGFMSVYSDVDKGTVFRVYLPATSEAAAEAAEPIVVPRGKGELILLVEDNQAVRTVAAATLEAYGYRVAIAKDGADAIKQYEKLDGKIALIVTDITMPTMDGPALMRAIATRDPSVPFVVISGLADAGSRHLPPDIPVARVLAKPFTASVLLQAVYGSKR